jgi:hypothetical protein
MPSEFESQQAVNRGQDARNLLESPLLREAFAKLKAGYIEQLMNTDATQSDIRDKYWMAARVVDVVRDHLTKVINDGAVARHDLEKLAREGERRKRFGIV